jgi:hypothetical protein
MQLDGGWPRNGSEVGPHADLIAYYGDQQFIMIYQYVTSLTLTLEAWHALLVGSTTPTLAYIVPRSRLPLATISGQLTQPAPQASAPALTGSFKERRLLPGPAADAGACE